MHLRDGVRAGKTDKREILQPPESASGLSSSPTLLNEIRRAFDWRRGENLCVDDGVAVRGADGGRGGVRAADHCRKGNSSLPKVGVGGAL